MDKNLYDNLTVRVNELYDRWPVDRKADIVSAVPVWLRSPFHWLYQCPLLPMRWRYVLWHFFRRTQLDQTWFEIFRQYWQEVLGGRPLWGVHDLYFLQGVYRMKFQSVAVPDTLAADQHLTAWQQPEVLYQLLHLVYKESVVSDLHLLRLIRKYHRGPIHTWLEFGCATAPFATALFEFQPPKASQGVYIADIQTAAFHYAAYKFRTCQQVKPLLLKAEDNFSLHMPEPADVVVCITVLEHLQHALVTIQQLHQTLRRGGILVFDYMLSEGTGLDTPQAIRDRSKVLDFIQAHFTIVAGRLSADQSMPVTVARKFK